MCVLCFTKSHMQTTWATHKFENVIRTHVRYKNPHAYAKKYIMLDNDGITPTDF